jgi:hypothetical protein
MHPSRTSLNSFFAAHNIMSQRIAAIRTKAGVRLAHDALHGIVYQPVPPTSRPPLAQFSMTETAFKRLVLLKSSGMEKVETKAITAKAEIPKKEAIQECKAVQTNSSASIFRHLTKWIAPQIVQILYGTATTKSSDQPPSLARSLGTQSIAPSESKPKMASFQGPQPFTSAIFKQPGSRKAYNHITPHIAGAVPSLAQNLIEWHNKLGGLIQELRKVEF